MPEQVAGLCEVLGGVLCEVMIGAKSINEKKQLCRNQNEKRLYEYFIKLEVGKHQ